MDIYDSIQKANKEKEDIMKSFFGNESTPELVKRIEDSIEKGKRAVIGEIRVYSGIPYKKVSSTGNPNKDWVRVRDSEGKVIESNKSQEKEYKNKEILDNLYKMAHTGAIGSKTRTDAAYKLIALANQKTQDEYSGSYGTKGGGTVLTLASAIKELGLDIKKDENSKSDFVKSNLEYLDKEINHIREHFEYNLEKFGLTHKHKSFVDFESKIKEYRAKCEKLINGNKDCEFLFRVTYSVEELEKYSSLFLLTFVGLDSWNAREYNKELFQDIINSGSSYERATTDVLRYLGKKAGLDIKSMYHKNNGSRYYLAI